MRSTLSRKCCGKKFLFAVLFIASVLPKAMMAQQSFFSYDNRTFFEADMRLGKYFPFEERHAYMKVLPQYGLDLRIGRQTDGRAQWEKDFNHLSYGAFLRLRKTTWTASSIETAMPMATSEKAGSNSATATVLVVSSMDISIKANTGRLITTSWAVSRSGRNTATSSSAQWPMYTLP